MKIKILIFLLLISQNTYAQVQKIFFVEDVKSIKYVSVKFCVNEIAKIDKVTVQTEKTTYENSEMIEQLRKYLLQ